jgi:hypothetical protein
MNDTQVFLAHLPQDKIETFFGEVLLEGVMLEVLDPKELGDRWQNVTFFDPKELGHNQEGLINSNMQTLENVISKYSHQYSFEEKYEEGSISKVLQNWQERNLMDAAQKLYKNSIVNKKFLQQKSVLKKTKSGWEVTIIKDLKALYTKYEINQKIKVITSKVFRLTSDSDALFVCFISPAKDFGTVKALLDRNQIDFEITTWVKSIAFSEVNDQEEFVGFTLSDFDRKFVWIFNLFSFVFCSIVIHDVLVGIIILLMSLIAQRFDLKYRNMSSQMWVGFGAIITGIIGGSFGSNLLQVLSVSLVELVKNISQSLLSFFGLFKIVDWSDTGKSFVINMIADFQVNLLHSGLVFGFGALSLFVVFIGIMIRIIKDFKFNNLKKGVTGIVFLLNLIVAGFCFAGLLPYWTLIISCFALLIYQPPFKLAGKVPSFLFGQYGVVGFVEKACRTLLFSLMFGLMIGSSAALNSINNRFSGNTLALILVNIIFALVIWQLTFVLTNKALCGNFLLYFVPKTKNSKQRLFDPITKYKYWRY